MDSNSLNRIKMAAVENIVAEVEALLHFVEITGTFDLKRVAETKRKLIEYKKIAGL